MVPDSRKRHVDGDLHAMTSTPTGMGICKDDARLENVEECFTPTKHT